MVCKVLKLTSRSWSFESITLTPAACACASSRNTADCCSKASTSVVLPWSTWAMIAMFLILVASCLVANSVVGGSTTVDMEVALEVEARWTWRNENALVDVRRRREKNFIDHITKFFSVIYWNREFKWNWEGNWLREELWCRM